MSSLAPNHLISASSKEKNRYETSFHRVYAHSETAIRLLHVIQGSLELSEVITDLHAALSDISPVKNLTFCYQETVIAIGVPGAQSESYDLVYNQDSIGTITFQVNDLNDTHRTLITDILLLSLRPIANAIGYQDAMARMHLDHLTGCYNRVAFDDDFYTEFELARRHNTNLALMVFDIDNFKLINDSYGHAVGDKVLQVVAQNLRQNLRSCDRVYRYGGEEFCLLLKNTPEQSVAAFAQRLCRFIARKPYIESELTLQVTVSGGVSFKQDSDNPQDMFERADNKLYLAKNSGKNQIALSSVSAG